MNTSEKTIWYSFLSGDKNAFSVIYKMYYSILYGYGLKLSNNPNLTKDCLQDFFISLHNNRAGIGTVESIKAYLFVSYKRALLKALIKERRFFGSDIKIVNEVNIEFSPEEIGIQREMLHIKSKTLAKLLNSLSKREREAIYLKYYSELKVSEISSVMKISYQSVLNTIQKAFKKIRHKAENEAIKKILQN